MTTKLWDAMAPAQQATFQAAAEKAIDDYTVKFVAQEKEVLDFFKKEGKKVYTPGPRRLPHLRAEEIRRQVRQRLAEGRARAHQRPVDAAHRRTARRAASPFDSMAGAGDGRKL